MSDQARMRCFSKMRPLLVKPHDVIVCSSDTKSSSEAASLYIIECGEVEATHGLEQQQQQQQQQQQVVERLSRGDFFGEIELLSVARRLLQAEQRSQEERDSQTAPPSPHKSGGGSEQTCSYVALTGGRVWRLSIDDFLEATRDDSGVGRKMESLTLLLHKATQHRKMLTKSRSFEDMLQPPQHTSSDWHDPRYEDRDLLQSVYGRVHAIIPGRLAFVIHEDETKTKEQILERRDLFFFSTTFHEEYQPLCLDFGPVSLASIHFFCRELQVKLSDPRLKSRHLVYYAEGDFTRRTNAAFLLGAYCVLVEGWTPEKAAQTLHAMGGPTLFPPYRDATNCESSFDITFLDTYRGLVAGKREGWYDSNSFNAEQYEAWAVPSSYDMHVICPKFLAFRGPNDSDSRFPHASVYCNEFVRMGVAAVVRLNEPQSYPASVFQEAGIEHRELYFDDCTMPPPSIAKAFLDMCNTHDGMIAVHCYAGLGRTGTLICMWIMKHCGWTAREAIAWCRIVRPGSVIGMQQHYLVQWEHQLRRCDGALLDPQDVCVPDLDSLSQSEADNKRSIAESCAKMALDVARGTRRKAHAPSAEEEASEIARRFSKSKIGRTSLLGGTELLDVLGVWEHSEWEGDWDSNGVVVI